MKAKVHLHISHFISHADLEVHASIHALSSTKHATPQRFMKKVVLVCVITFQYSESHFKVDFMVKEEETFL